MHTNAFALTRKTETMSSTLTATESIQTPAPNGSTPLIRLNGVTKVFLTDEVETHALSGIHLDIRTGEYVSIAGPSGCGKTTLLSILGLLDTASDGSYSLNGNEVATLSFPYRARMRNGEAVMDLLKELHASGATICMVTHDERFAQHAQRTVHLFDGRVVEDRMAA